MKANLNTMNHDAFFTFVENNTPAEESRSPFEIRKGEHAVPICSEREKYTTFSEAEFLVNTGVINQLAIDVLKALAVLRIGTPIQIETYWCCNGFFPTPSRKVVLQMIKRLIHYSFIKAERFECDESTVPTAYILTLDKRGQEILYAYYGIRGTVVSSFHSIEPWRIKKQLACNQLAMHTFPESTLSCQCIREASTDVRAIQTTMIDNSLMVEIVRRNDNWESLLEEKLNAYENYLGSALNEELSLLLVVENNVQLSRVEQMFENKELSFSRRVLVTNDKLIYRFGEQCPFLIIPPTNEEKRETGLFAFLRRWAS